MYTKNCTVRTVYISKDPCLLSVVQLIRQTQNALEAKLAAASLHPAVCVVFLLSVRQITSVMRHVPKRIRAERKRVSLFPTQNQSVMLKCALSDNCLVFQATA